MEKGGARTVIVMIEMYILRRLVQRRCRHHIFHLQDIN